MEEFRKFAIDTAYRCGWTFTQALLSCMTFGQKQIGKWCFDHIKEPDELPRQFTFNSDSINEMLEGRSDGKENDTAEQ